MSRTISAATAAAAATSAALRLPPESSDRRKGDLNARLRGDRTVNGSTAHPIPYGALGGGTGPTARRPWAPADGWDGVDDGGASGGKSLGAVLEGTRKAIAMSARSEGLLGMSHAEGGPVRGQDEEKEALVPERFSEPVSGPVPGLGPKPFPERFSEPSAQERGGGEGRHEENVKGFSGAGAEVGASGGEKEAIDDKLPLMLASLERVALTVNDLQGRCVRLSHGENYGELCTTGS